jgi:hypothetical protein
VKVEIEKGHGRPITAGATGGPLPM